MGMESGLLTALALSRPFPSPHCRHAQREVPQRPYKVPSQGNIP